MHLFVNECSLRGQYHDRASFQRAVVHFASLVDRVRRATVTRNVKLLRSETLADCLAIRYDSLRKSLNQLAGRDLKEGFVSIVFDQACPMPWTHEQQHQDHFPYPWRQRGDQHMRSTSMAELAERQSRGTAGALLNFLGSNVTLPITVGTPLGDQPLIALENADDFERWRRLNDTSPPVYSAEAIDPPHDEQTCLHESRFELTEMLVQGRHVYRHRTSRDLYYVDNVHFGAAAHLEIFDKLGRRHLGEAELNGSKRPGTADRSKQPIS